MERDKSVMYHARRARKAAEAFCLIAETMELNESEFATAVSDLMRVVCAHTGMGIMEFAEHIKDLCVHAASVCDCEICLKAHAANVDSKELS